MRGIREAGRLVIPDIGGEGMWSYAGFTLSIADGGRLELAPGTTLTLDDNANRYRRMELGRDAVVTGLDLYETDGETPVSYPTKEAMSFVYLGASYNDEPYAGLPKEKWVRVTGTYAPVTAVEIAEGDEVWLTSGAAASSLHAFAAPKDAYDTAAFWITTNDVSTEGPQCNKEAVYDSNRKCYLPTVVKISYGKSKPMDERLCAYSRDGAVVSSILVHFRPADDPEMTSVTGLSLNKTETSLTVGGSERLIAAVAPEDATTKNVWWESGDERVVTVDQNGVVNAVGTGTAIVACTTLDNPTTVKCTVTVTEDEIPQQNPFNDVKADAFYYDAVLWAVDHTPQITTGTGANTFSPDKTCTRAQVVTFLWRARGCPEPKDRSNPFADVKDGDYFFDAVLWAVENGITTGTGANKFGPKKDCTRGQVVTFLWRAEGSPDPAKTDNPFADVSVDQYYYTAVLWAVGRGITSGTSATKFSPGRSCTRGQIVTFLYRDMGR